MNENQLNSVCSDRPLCDIPQSLRDTQAGNNEMRPFNVRKLNYGYIIDVGCQTFAIEKKETLIKLLTMYIDNPAKTEKLWFSNQLFI